MRHLPTGIEAKSAERSQFTNKRIAREVLEARVSAYYNEQRDKQLSKERRLKAGTGMRGDKIRTYREQDDVVIDHRNDRKWRLKDFIRGKILFT